MGIFFTGGGLPAPTMGIFFAGGGLPAPTMGIFFTGGGLPALAMGIFFAGRGLFPLTISILRNITCFSIKNTLGIEIFLTFEENNLQYDFNIQIKDFKASCLIIFNLSECNEI